MGQSFALLGWHVAQEFWLFFTKFLKRFGDNVVEVCIVVVRFTKVCLKANPSSLEASQDLGVFAYHIRVYNGNSSFNVWMVASRIVHLN